MPQEKYTVNKHPKNGHPIMKGSVLSVNVIDARNLKPAQPGRRFVNSLVKLKIEGQ